MSTIVTYTNYLNDPITEQQSLQISDFNKVFKENNEVKKIEEYKNKSLVNLIYYKENNEATMEILNNYSEVKFLEIVEKFFYNSYLIERIEYFMDGVSRGFGKKLLDSNDNIICVEFLDELENPIYKETEKYFIENNERVLSFCYNEDGTINYIWGDWVEETDQRQKGSIYFDKISIYFPDFLNNNPYYLNAVFLP